MHPNKNIVVHMLIMTTILVLMASFILTTTNENVSSRHINTSQHHTNSVPPCRRPVECERERDLDLERPARGLRSLPLPRRRVDRAGPDGGCLRRDATGLWLRERRFLLRWRERGDDPLS